LEQQFSSKFKQFLRRIQNKRYHPKIIFKMETKRVSVRIAHLYLTLIVLAVCLFAACRKDNKASSPSSSPPLIGFQSKQLLTIGQLDTANLLGTSADMFDLEVTLSVPSNINSPISATIVPDSGALSVYNAYQQQKSFPPQGWSGRSYIPFRQLSASYYTLQNGGKVTINPGQQSVTVRVSFAGDKIDFYNNNAFENALSLKLIAPNGATLVSSLSQALILIRPQSAYEGNYQTTGAETEAGTSQTYSNNYDQLSSVTPNTVLKQTFGSYGQLMYLTVNTDNSVSINFLVGVPAPFYIYGLSNAMIFFSTGPTQSFSQIGVNKYDPATKTFTLNYQLYLNKVLAQSVSETSTLKN